MKGFRHADPRFPFLWEDAGQPPARWHGPGEGPAHYLADTPDGAWAELLRHEEITDPADLEGVRRALWMVEVPDPPECEPDLEQERMTGGLSSYPVCQSAARRLRDRGEPGLQAPSAALEPSSAGGFRVDGGLQPGPPRSGRILVLFGRRPDLVGWRITDAGQPPAELLDRVRPLSD